METTDRNPYIFGDPETDRFRLETQARISATQVRDHARNYVGNDVRSILDLGCGAGQLGFVLRDVYPDARLVGIDRDPGAVELARDRAAERRLGNCDFVVGDVQDGLPAGPFDLVFAELIFLHIRDTAKVLQSVYEVLAPGGSLWIKDINPDLRERVNHPAYQKLVDMLFQSLTAIGAHPRVIEELPPLLAEAGFEAVRNEVEEYVMGGTTDAGRAMLATTLGAFYNARMLISKVSGSSEEEIARLYAAVANYALMREEPIGTQLGMNLLARRPMTERG